MITIQNNKRQHRILIFDSPFNLEDSNDFTYEMFDAVFILTSSPDEVKSILHTINPVTSHKCCYKPFMVSRDLKGQLDEYDELIDNYTYDIDDSNTLDSVEEIINHVKSIGLQPDEHRFLSGNLFFIRLYRYLISRHTYSLTPKLNGASSMGYTISIFELFFRQNAYSLNEYIMFNQSLLEKGYIHPVSFINKIYLCPRCLHSHLLYIESCPHCHSSAIKSEEVIHHFRCANISPEHTYNFGGQLRCPKCHRLLRHIGVDYDRPSVVYTCSHCESTFLQPHMNAVCATCNNHTDVSELTPYDITSFEITQEGREAIVSPNIGFTIYTDFYDNYMEFERFVNRLRLLSEQKGTGSIDARLEVVKVWVLNADEETCPLSPDFIALFCKHFPTYRISSVNNMVYLKNTIYADKDNQPVKEMTDRLDSILKNAATTIKPDERICYAVSQPSGNMEEFVNDLHYISLFPTKTFAFRADNGQEAITENLISTEENLSVTTTSAMPASKEHPSFIRYVVVALLMLATIVLYVIFHSTEKQAIDKPHPCMEQEEVTAVIPDSIQESTVAEMPEAKADKPLDIEQMESGVYYAVTNVFRSKENAFMQIRIEMSEHPSCDYRIYQYGNRFIISPFHSTDRAQCQQFISAREWKGDAWIAVRKD